MKKVACLMGVWMAIGCGASTSTPGPAERPKPPATATAQMPERSRASKPLRLTRSDVHAAVDAGLGRFLQHVDVEPALQNGSFEGFRILTLRPAQFWHGVDLRPGDVVVRVNGASIERDSEAYAVFTSLKSARAVEVDYLRGGQPRRLIVPIEGEPARASADPPAR